MKRVLLIVIDALATRILRPALDAGRLPCMERLIDRGLLREECTSIYPSITPAATGSIVTGVYPNEHHIAGAFWYERDEDCVAYYGDDFWVMVQEGMGEFFNDFLVRLNHDRLHAPTLYQQVERHGLTAAAINYMWFLGETEHEVNAPLLLKLLPGVSFASSVRGPKVLALADFASSTIPGRNEPLSARGGVSRRYGFHDDVTAEYLQQLATADPFPEFTLAYFPNNDFISHQEGPANAVSALEQVDSHLQEFIDTMGGLEAFLEEFAIVITGDHSQSDMIDDQQEQGIDLSELLSDYQLARPGRPWEEGDELMLCPNMRACHVYLRNRSPEERDLVIERLLSEPRVDQVFWRCSSWDSGEPTEPVDPRTDTFQVVTAEHGVLTFHHAREGESLDGCDLYGTGWVWDGDLGGIDATLDANGQLVYGKYPNAFERIATGFSQRSGDLWVNAKLGYEFGVPETSIHRGGSHGALNTDDSTAPLIVAGVPEGIDVPRHPRTIDVAPLCLQVLGLEDEADQLIRDRVAGPPC